MSQLLRLAFNTEIATDQPERSGKALQEFKGMNIFTGIGDFCLTSIRYLFRGKTIHIIKNQEQASSSIAWRVDSVASFHIEGDPHHSRTYEALHSRQITSLRTCFHLGLFLLCIPTIIGFVSKLVGLYFAPRNCITSIYQHWQQTDPVINLQDRDISQIAPENYHQSYMDALRLELQQLRSHPLHRKIRTLKIIGTPQFPLQIDYAPDVFRLSPKNLVLQHATIQTTDLRITSAFDTPLHQQMTRSHKWRKDTAAAGAPLSDLHCFGPMPQEEAESSIATPSSVHRIFLVDSSLRAAPPR